ncbi:23S rRNA (pseudouridine(1915)-N(3))-methyltransferase RlmH [uncultured Cytophaga sp.]|uniref:23S rRNA (pseudouridine(1915)-N(3))-methyltransferase RlmH n=1 Tax=uncultured Cytophaga sp. TaxID=160238 RepID=UPI002616ADF3|nr:23S rRNA (pseudouridine(1915)-N(3))-methyltransferase RlmH [uncultured Cytophaga sp.]
MKLHLWTIGKTNDAYLKEGCDQYLKRLPHYLPFEYIEIPEPKNTKLSSDVLKKEEEKILLSRLQDSDQLILLDEKGSEFTSAEFSQFIQKKMNTVSGNLIFLIGGPYGFSEAIYKRANGKVGLSKMTLSHQMVRLFALEQLYRACTIIKGEKYHH